MKIILIGKGDGWEKAPTEGETWGVNTLLLRRPVKLTFEMHDLDLFLASERFGATKKQMVEEINKLGIPVITREKHKLLPTAIPFPIDEMPVKYFTNSISYMIAYAIYKGATEIEMYGIAMLLESEFTHQRACVEFWIGYAMRAGIKVTVHGRTTIFSANKYKGLYGYDWDVVEGQKIKRKVLQAV